MEKILFLIIFLLTGVAHGKPVKDVIVVGESGFPPHELTRRIFEREFSRLDPAGGGKDIESDLHFYEVPVGAGGFGPNRCYCDPLLSAWIDPDSGAGSPCRRQR